MKPGMLEKYCLALTQVEVKKKSKSLARSFAIFQNALAYWDRQNKSLPPALAKNEMTAICTRKKK